GNSQGQLTAGANVDLHRFFEGTGILLPVALNYARNTSRPRFTAGDDVIRTGALEAASESKSTLRSLSVNYSRIWSPRALPLLRYTLGGITASYSRNQSDATSPTGVATYKGMAASVNYGIAPRDLLILRVPLTKARFYPLPEHVFWNYNIATSEQLAYDRTQDASALVLRNDLTGRIASINFGA